MDDVKYVLRRSRNMLPPMRSNLTRVGSDGAERVPWMQYKRHERDKGRQSACGGTYLYA